MISILMIIAFSLLTIFSIRQLWWLFQVVPPNITKIQVAQKILNTIAVCALPVWPLAAFVGLFMFDSGGSKKITEGFYLSMFFYPVFVVPGFLFFRKGWEEENSLKMNLSSLAIMVCPITASYFFFYIKEVCDGKFC